jgi:anti-sigma factor ChrR (cupin superfamily)
MNLNHTVDEIAERASLYAIGALSQNEARAFEEHLAAGCEACEAELRPFQSVITALALAAPEDEPPASAREKLMARMAETSASKSTKPDVSQFFTVRANEGQWLEGHPGIMIKQLFVDEKTGTVTSLFKFAPGAHAPIHKHDGIEQCLVLEGDFCVNDESFGPGDFTSAMPGTVHHTAYSKRGALLLIVAQAGYQMSAPSGA